MGLIGPNFGNAIAARTTQFSRPVQAFVSQPEPRSIGLAHRGTQILNGQFLFAGRHVEAPDVSIWDVPVPDAAFEAAIQGFGWLDHLVAVGSKTARLTAQDWVQDWIVRYGAGRGAGWTPQLTGRRVVRWINHGLLLLQNQSSDQSKAYFRSLAHQAGFLANRWRAADSGLPRIEALTGLVYCGLALETKRSYLSKAVSALGAECSANIGPDGSIPSRNPEEVMTVFTLLTWAAAAITDADAVPHREHLLAMERMVPLLRSLRLGDGGLAHFHGGGRGAEGRLDQALKDASIRLDGYPRGGMNIARMSHAGSLLLMDTGELPKIGHAHHGPLSFEMSAGSQPLVVNAGPGHYFSAELAEAAAHVTTHSTVNVAQQNPNGKVRRRSSNLPAPKVERTENLDFEMLVASHSYYADSHGLTLYRTLEMAKTGGLLRGRDRLVSDTDTQKAAFDKWFTDTNKRRMPIAANFILPPDVEPEMGLGNTAVSLTLPNGAVWVFQSKGSEIAIQESLYFQFGRLRPRKTHMIVLSDSALHYEGTINWTLTRA